MLQKMSHAQEMGSYRKTAVDEAKEKAQFLITAIVGKKTEILWRGGGRELVTNKRLEALKLQYTWACDF